MPPTAGRHHVTDQAELPGLNETIVEQARAARAHAERREGWVLSLDQPTYVAVVTDAESQRSAARLLRSLEHARLGPGPERRALGQLAGDGGHPQPAARGGAAARFQQLRRIRARQAHGAQRRGGPANFCSSWRGRRVRSAEREFAELEAFAGRPLQAWDVGFYAERLQRSRYRGLAGGAAAVLSAAARARGPVRSRRTPVWCPHPSARRRGAVASGRRASSRSSDAAGHAARQLLPRCLCATQQAQRRLDGRVRRPQAAWPQARHCRWPTWCATSFRRSERLPGAADARRRGDTVPRVWPRPAPSC